MDPTMKRLTPTYAVLFMRNTAWAITLNGPVTSIEKAQFGLGVGLGPLTLDLCMLYLTEAKPPVLRIAFVAFRFTVRPGRMSLASKVRGSEAS